MSTGKVSLLCPAPFAIDASGKRFDMDFNLDKENRIITINGDLSGARYPIIVDPTERVTNGFFLDGLEGWTIVNTCPPEELYILLENWFGYPTVYGCLCANNCYVGLGQDVDLTNVTTLSVDLLSDPWTENEGVTRLAVFVDETEVYTQYSSYDHYITNIQHPQKKSNGLSIAADEKNIQHLVWSFEVIQKDEFGFNKGGDVGIDAQNGDVVWRTSIA
nr:hypothetical protein [uncultured Methanoregula sp.]